MPKKSVPKGGDKVVKNTNNNVNNNVNKVQKKIEQSDNRSGIVSNIKGKEVDSMPLLNPDLIEKNIDKVFEIISSKSNPLVNAVVSKYPGVYDTVSSLEKVEFDEIVTFLRKYPEVYNSIATPFVKLGLLKPNLEQKTLEESVKERERGEMW